MFVYKTREFTSELEKLPLGIKRLFQKQETIFKKNWLEPRLHTKRVRELPGVYSFRITRRYRALFYFKNNEAVFFSIGHRKDIYR